MTVAPPRALGAVALVLALAGCSVVDVVRRSPPPRPTPTPPPAAFELRSSVVRVPVDFRARTVSFLDARFGAALFTKCSLPKRRVGNHNDCTARLFVTDDGGGSWVARDHPEPVADGHQLTLGAAGQVALLAEPRHWYLSSDGGRTFRPSAVDPLPAEYEICCDREPEREVLRSGRPLPAAPALSQPLTSVLARPGRDLWVAGAEGTAVSGDDGRSWTTVVVPGRKADVTQLTLRASADNEDVWLLAGTVAPRAYPQIWRLDGGAWLPVEAEGHPRDSISAAPVGGGALAVSTPSGIGLVAPGQGWRPTDWPARGLLRTLRDGSLLARDDLTGALWLGPGGGARRAWIKLELRPEP
jgi:hypothetical protein